ncbi:MAG: hypothetical protein WB765_05430 [Acidimicrobiales bacterium]
MVFTLIVRTGALLLLDEYPMEWSVLATIPSPVRKSTVPAAVDRLLKSGFVLVVTSAEV